ncbi:MAG: amidohydrolase family protein [Nitrospiraceae bacterium]|nr:amidohydrolase family protein [Nitrospiraceae bacterium]
MERKSGVSTMPPPARRPTTKYVDAHVHLRDLSGVGCAADAGIAAIRDAGSSASAEQGAPIGSGAHRAVLVVSSGWALYKKGGYGSAFGLPMEGKENFHDEILRLKSAGAGIIKIMASGMVSLRKRDSITPGGFDGDELALLVQEARSVGLEVMAHANGEQAIIDCAEAGVRSVEHGFFMTARALDVMARQNTFWTPTVGALARAADVAEPSGEIKAHIREVIRTHLEMIGEARALGVPLAIGTDCVLPHPRYRAIYDAELAYFAEAGLSLEAVQQIACENGARLLGM